MTLLCNGDNSYLFPNGEEIFKFKANNGNLNFLTQFCPGNMSNGFGGAESRQVSLKGMCMIFQSITVLLIILVILNIHTYLMVKKNKMFWLIQQVFTAVLSFRESSTTKCVALYNEPCMTEPVELNYCPFMINLDKYSGSCNSIDNLSTKIAFQVKQKT